jgi:hypothetical protein
VNGRAARIGPLEQNAPKRVLALVHLQEEAGLTAHFDTSIGLSNVISCAEPYEQRQDPGKRGAAHGLRGVGLVTGRYRIGSAYGGPIGLSGILQRAN